MSETTKRLKANKRLAERECPRCGESLQFGEDAVVCEPCDQGYHASCWDSSGGCATEDCENQALAQLDPETSGKKGIDIKKNVCPHCGKRMPSRAKICRFCKKAPTPDGIYRGPRLRAPGATAALVFGIMGIFICGLIFGLAAISKAGEAEKAIARDPTLEGTGLAKAGRVLGIISLVLWGLIIVGKATQR